MLIYKIVVIFRNLYFILLEFSGNLKYLALLFSCPNNNYTVNYLDLLPSMTYLLYFIISLVIANLYISSEQNIGILNKNLFVTKFNNLIVHFHIQNGYSIISHFREDILASKFDIYKWPPSLKHLIITNTLIVSELRLSYNHSKLSQRSFMLDFRNSIIMK